MLEMKSIAWKLVEGIESIRAGIGHLSGFIMPIDPETIS
jgi:hypothetical protein